MTQPPVALTATSQQETASHPARATPGCCTLHRRRYGSFGSLHSWLCTLSRRSCSGPLRARTAGVPF
eukprot:365102-Chlamydomonas_euryale.AAC.9